MKALLAVALQQLNTAGIWRQQELSTHSGVGKTHLPRDKDLWAAATSTCRPGSRNTGTAGCRPS